MRWFGFESCLVWLGVGSIWFELCLMGLELILLVICLLMLIIVWVANMLIGHESIELLLSGVDGVRLAGWMGADINIRARLRASLRCD